MIVGLSAYQVESYVQDVASAMEALGYDTKVTDPTGPEVEVCMWRPGKPELCTDLTEAGTPWVKYSPSNIASIQSDRYKFMNEDQPIETAAPPSSSSRVSVQSRTQTPAAAERSPASSTSVETDAEQKAQQAQQAATPLSGLLSNPWLLLGGGAVLLFALGRKS